MNETLKSNTNKKETPKSRELTHINYQWGALASDLKAGGPKTQKAYYDLANKQNPDGTWPEPTAQVTDYVYYQRHNAAIAETLGFAEDVEYNTLPGKLQRLTSPNPDGSETLVFSLNQYNANDVAHQACHYLLANLQAELGITNTVLYADEIMIFALQYGLNVGNRPRDITLPGFITNISQIIKRYLTKEEAEVEHLKFMGLATYVTKSLTPKMLQYDPQIIQPLQNETVRYEQYIANLHDLQESEIVKANLLKKVKDAGTWEIPYGPLEGFKEFEFGEIPPLTGNYSAEVAEINRLIGEIDDRIKSRDFPKKPD